MRAANAKLLTSHDGSFTSRALFPFDAPRRAEFYELHLHAHAVERADAHAPGTTENLVVTRGSVVIEAGGERHRLSSGDAILFAADVPHAYENPTDDEATIYLVMNYAIEIGG